jgi:exodeoxyribonuclease VIII
MFIEEKPGANIMVDLETLGTRSTSIILSIGACRVTDGEPSDPFYRVISVPSCRDAGLTSDASTERWWNQQNDEARRVFTDPSVTLIQALSDFSTYIRGFGSRSVRLWGNGSDFDNVILANAYSAVGSQIPWMFYHNRCFRTVRKLIGAQIKEPSREGTHHNALDDAMHQARILGQILKG